MKTRRTVLGLVAGATATALALSSPSAAETLKIGIVSATTGPLAAPGKFQLNGFKLAAEEVNAKGGVHGRQLKLIAEDHSYQMPKAMQNINKLVNSDKVFVMLLSLGTPMNIASFPLLERKGFANIGPLSAARQMVERLVEEPEVGQVYEGTVRRTAEFGAFVEILPDQDGLLHISELDVVRVNRTEDVVKVGDTVKVKVIEICL